MFFINACASCGLAMVIWNYGWNVIGYIVHVGKYTLVSYNLVRQVALELCFDSK